MARYVLGRVLGILGVLIAVSIITFGMMHLVPGGPFDTSEKMQRPLPEHIRNALMEKYNLDKPVYVQYLSYMGRVLHGDFGVSFKYGDPVTEVIARGWPTCTSRTTRSRRDRAVTGGCGGLVPAPAFREVTESG